MKIYGCVVLILLGVVTGCQSDTKNSLDSKSPEAVTAFKGEGAKVSPERQKEIDDMMKKAMEENNARLKAKGKMGTGAPPVP